MSLNYHYILNLIVMSISLFCLSTYHILDPFVSLSLRINKERPPSGELHNHTILHREHVPGQTSNLPVTYLDRLPQDGGEISCWCVWDGVLGQSFLPKLNQLHTILALRWPQPGIILYQNITEGRGCCGVLF